MSIALQVSDGRGVQAIHVPREDRHLAALQDDARREEETNQAEEDAGKLIEAHYRLREAVKNLHVAKLEAASGIADSYLQTTEPHRRIGELRARMQRVQGNVERALSAVNAALDEVGDLRGSL